MPRWQFGRRPLLTLLGALTIGSVTLGAFTLGARTVAGHPGTAAAPVGATIAADTVASAVADRLVFGRAIPGGGSVSGEEWAAFVREVVTPRFPDGLTLWSAEGQWRDPKGQLVREPVMIIEVFHSGSASADSAFAAIATEYRRRFRQDAVLRVASPVRTHLYEAGSQRVGAGP